MIMTETTETVACPMCATPCEISTNGSWYWIQCPVCGYLSKKYDSRDKLKEALDPTSGKK
jgi:rubrerythrin